MDTLDNQLCFKLYALSRMVTAVYRPALEKLDITYPQYLVLLVLWERKTVTVKDLGALLYLDSGTLTPLLKRLEQKQLISRTRDKNDERSVIIGLTDTGSLLHEQAAHVPDTLKNCITIKADQYKNLKGQLDKMLLQLTT